MQELKLCDELILKVIKGERIGTIRKGKPNIKLAWLRLAPINETVEPIVVTVRCIIRARLEEFTLAVAQSEGYKTLAEFHKALNDIYPGCKMKDEFSWISWYNHSGKCSINDCITNDDGVAP